MQCMQAAAAAAVSSMGMEELLGRDLYQENDILSAIMAADATAASCPPGGRGAR